MEQSVTITRVRVLKGYRLKLTFSDGSTGTVDLSGDIAEQGGDFAALKDPQYFRRVRLNRDVGTVQWPNEVDYCPNLLREMTGIQSRPKLRHASAA